MLVARGCCTEAAARLVRLQAPECLDVLIKQGSVLERCLSGASASTSIPTSHSQQSATQTTRKASTSPSWTLHNVIQVPAQTAASLDFSRWQNQPWPVGRPVLGLRPFASAVAAPAATAAEATTSSGTASAEPLQTPSPADSGKTTEVPWPWVDPTRPRVLPVAVDRKRKPPVPLDMALMDLLTHLTDRQRTRYALEVAVRFGLDPRRSDHLVRGSAALPYGTGKEIKLVVFAKGLDAEIARENGVDLIGDEELINAIVASNGDAIKFDKLIATPEFMRPLAKAGKVLGPKGLMPNPKMGTLTTDVAGAIREIRRGRLDYRLGRDSCIRTVLGRVSMPAEQLAVHVGALVASLLENKPKGVGGPVVVGTGAAAAGAKGGAGQAAKPTVDMLEGYVKRFLLKTTKSQAVEITHESLLDAIERYRAVAGSSKPADESSDKEGAAPAAAAAATGAATAMDNAAAKKY